VVHRPRSRLGADGRSLDRLDPIADVDLAFREDLRPQPAPVHKAREHSPVRESLEVGARLTQPHASQPHRSHEEFPADEMVQRHAPRHDVPPRVTGRDMNLIVAAQGVDRLEFNQRDFPPGARTVGVRPRGEEVAVSLDPRPGTARTLSTDRVGASRFDAM